ncbi:hypothetical protein DVH24_029794 [Malus domestica]|uniref:Uncharacterized protein n=1 Tax=Malus domestica TaxID=3750 RepID=A0A498I1R9_MALDO|nr:hypothetical protein DVH24_029794 [Malus domestica]
MLLPFLPYSPFQSGHFFLPPVAFLLVHLGSDLQPLQNHDLLRYFEMVCRVLGVPLARDVLRGEMLQLLWRCLDVDKDLVGSRSAVPGVELSCVCGLLCVLGFNFWLALCNLFFGHFFCFCFFFHLPFHLLMVLLLFLYGFSHPSTPVDIPFHGPSVLYFSTMVSVEFVCKVLVLYPARVFPTPSRSPCCLPFAAVLLEIFPKLLFNGGAVDVMIGGGQRIGWLAASQIDGG